jgi:glycosyltransferase involved in cell wall biosynthesis
MKFAFFHHSLRLGSGIDTVITELASRLAKNDEVTVYCFYTDYEIEKYSFQIEVIESPYAATTNRISILAPFILDKIRGVTSKLEKHDVLNTHVFPANYISRNLKNPLKVVTEWTVGPPHLWSSSFKQRLYTRYLVYKGDKAAVQNADLVISASRFIRKWVQDNYNVNPALLYLDGINFDLLNSNRANAEKILKTYPRLEGKYIILYVGRITDHKNIHTLVESFRKLKQKISNIMLLLVGDYKNYMGYYLMLQKLIKNYGLEDDVVFTGVVPWEDLPSYYSICSIYATCTLWEGFLRPESFALRKPIVCFDVGPNSETVSDGENGLLIRTQNPSRFADGLYRLLSNDTERKKMGEAGYNWAKEYLDFDAISIQFRAICEQNLK